MSISVNDCKGLSVKFPKQLIKTLQLQLINIDSYDCLTKVVESPGLIIETNNINSRYYFRAIGWNVTALIKVERQKGEWSATDGYINPPKETLIHLFVNGIVVEDKS